MNEVRFEDLDRVVSEAVNAVQVVDVHTHIFPPSHGKLMLWGIDDLLTYHYLIAGHFLRHKTLIFFVG